MRSVCIASIAVAALLSAASPAHAQHWRPGERTLITEFDQVGAVATDMRNVYGATPNGLIVYDRFARTWLAPSTVLDGFPVGHIPTALAHDPFTGDLWMGTRAGVIFRYTPAFGRWEQATMVGGTVRTIGFARDDAFIEANGEWLVSRGGMFSPERISAAQVPADIRDRASGAAYEQDPFLRTALGALPPDAAGNRWRALALTPGDRRGTWWIGSDGGGLLHYDARSSTAEWLPYGLPTIGATLVARAAGMLWFAGEPDAYRPGIAIADTALARWQRVDAQVNGGPADVVFDVVEAHGRVWLGAADGLFAVRTRDVARLAQRAAWMHVDALDGLPDARVYALAPSPTGIWAGTARGLVHVDTAGVIEAEALILPGTGVYDLAVQGATLWAATDRGLVQVDAVGAASIAAVPPAAAGALRGIATVGGDLWVLTADGLHHRPQSGEWQTYREPALAGIGALRRLEADAAGLTIAAEQGAAYREAASGQWRYYTVPADVPAAPVASAIRVGDFIWLGTPAGALRLPITR